jgi:hypothetical protein
LVGVSWEHVDGTCLRALCLGGVFSSLATIVKQIWHRLAQARRRLRRGAPRVRWRWCALRATLPMPEPYNNLMLYTNLMLYANVQHAPRTRRIGKHAVPPSGFKGMGATSSFRYLLQIFARNSPGLLVKMCIAPCGNVPPQPPPPRSNTQDTEGSGQWNPTPFPESLACFCFLET